MGTDSMVTIEAYAKQLRNLWEGNVPFEEAIEMVGAQHSVFYGDLETLWRGWDKAFQG